MMKQLGGHNADSAASSSQHCDCNCDLMILFVVT